MVVPGFVLAGGASKRMGRDKALLPIDGEPLAARTARILSEGGCRPVHIVGNQPGLSGLDWPVLREPDGDHHPLRGVATALASLPDGLALFAPCDLPALTSQAIDSLLAVGGPCRVVGQPLLCVLSSEQAHRAAAHAHAGGSVRAFVAELEPLILPESVLLNANRPEDLL
ncbi:MAG: molybdopterin-guanine dinucleotide biosynthesis protein A [Myxococcota bacterium]|jgi:molybdopterin-guanine dinucleotide biosynthesis protein A